MLNSLLLLGALAASNSALAADRPPVVEQQSVTPLPMKRPFQAEAARPESAFDCTFKTWASGLAPGGQQGGTGVYRYGIRLDVRNTGTTTVFSAHGRLNVNINGQMRSKSCSIPSHLMMNQWVVEPGARITVPLECGSESNVTSTKVMSGTAHVKSSDNKQFGCTMLMYLPPVAR